MRRRTHMAAAGSGAASRRSPVAADDRVRVVAGVDRLPGRPGSPGPSHSPEGAEEATDGDGDEYGQAEPGAGPGPVDVGVEQHLGEERRHERGEGPGEGAEEAATDDGGDEAAAAGGGLRRWLGRWHLGPLGRLPGGGCHPPGGCWSVMGSDLPQPGLAPCASCYLLRDSSD